MPDILARFQTLGGADVELRPHRFSTRYLSSGRPDVGNQAYDVDGFTWACLGCGTTAATGARMHIQLDYGRYLPNEEREARDDANTHAASCRSTTR